MFKIDPAPTFRAEVSLSAPGQTEPNRLSIEWQHLDRKQLTEWIDALAAAQLSDVDGLAQVIAGWDGVVDHQGQNVPYSKDRLQALLCAYHAAGAELVRGYVRALTESRVGN